MNYPLCSSSVVAFALLASVAGAAQHDWASPLFTVESMLTRSREREVLSWREAEQIATLRSSPSRLSVALVVLNVRALDGGLITVVTPEGKTLTFEGAKSFDKHSNSYNWVGRGKLSRIEGVGYATFSWSIGERSLYGTLRWKEKVYEMWNFGRFGALAEVKVQPMNEPPSMGGS